MVLVHCTSSQCDWPLYEFVLYPTSGFQVILWTRKKQWKSNKGNNSIIILDRVMVLVHCTWSYCARLLSEVVLNSQDAPDKEK
jgi:hypothetical protein